MQKKRWVWFAAALAFLVHGTAYAQSEVGSEGHGCYPNDTCNTGLTCASHLCVKLASKADATESPPPPPPAERPKELNNWRAGNPVPDGYTPRTRPRWDFVAVGGVSWGILYLLYNV